MPSKALFHKFPAIINGDSILIYLNWVKFHLKKTGKTGI